MPTLGSGYRREMAQKVNPIKPDSDEAKEVRKIVRIKRKKAADLTGVKK